MHKTHHRRRRHHNRRTRRGGVGSVPASASASAASAQPNPALQTIINRVKELAAQAQAQAQAQPMKPSRSRSSRSGINKSEKRFKDILAGKVKHSHKSASKYGTHGRAKPGEQ
jgi:hypothetical protein